MNASIFDAETPAARAKHLDQEFEARLLLADALVSLGLLLVLAQTRVLESRDHVLHDLPLAVGSREPWELLMPPQAQLVNWPGLLLVALPLLLLLVDPPDLEGRGILPLLLKRLSPQLPS